MRSLSTAVFALIVCALPVLRAESIPSLTVLLSVEGNASALALNELKHELNSIMQDSGRTMDVRLREQVGPAETFEDLILVKLNGKCTMQRLIPLMDERGPLAWTHSTNGTILPFAEVSCDRIATAVAGALWAGERRKADMLLGRALGRVLAHELYHILGKTHEHNADGSVAKEALSAKQLISNKRLSFDVRDLHRMTP